MTPIEKVLSRLSDYNIVGENKYKARCPAHHDRRPSLSVSQGDDGCALVKCHAGCDTSAIVATLGLAMSDLFSVNGHSSQNRNDRSASTYPTAAAAVECLERKHGKRSTSWTYTDAVGNPVCVIVRWDTANGKDIRPVSRNGDGWIIGGMPEPRVLYRLPELADAKRVFVCEGEKCVDVALTLGLTATTSAHGSKSAAKADWRPLAGKEVIILPDNDNAGGKYAEDVAAILARLEPAPTVKVLLLPGLPNKGDIVDWLDTKSEAAEPDALRKDIEAMADAAPIYKPATTESDDEGPRVSPVLICMADVQSRPVNWLWNKRIPAGRISLIVGRPGLGKSFVTIDMASRVSTGTDWPDGSDCQKGSVILITAEDDPEDTIRPRLDAHCADVSRIHLLSAVNVLNSDGKTDQCVFTLADVGSLEAALIAVQDCRLIIIDPIGSYLGGRTDAHRDNEVRAVLSPIDLLAKKHGPAVVIVAHRRKSPGTVADDLALGSRAFTGFARAVWHVGQDSDDENRRLFLAGKNNLAAAQSGLAFSIFGEPAAIHWERDPVEMTADQGLQKENASKDSALQEAVDWLSDVLADGPVPGEDVKADADRAGISERTLARARKQIGVECGPSGFGGPWLWRLPESAQCMPSIPSVCQEKNLADSEETVADSGETDPEKPRQCWNCKGRRFWVSVHGTTRCGQCSPPAAPELVERWIDEKV